MSLVALILLLCCHFLSGYGMLALFNIRRKAAVAMSLSLLLGVAVASVVPFGLQLFGIRLTAVTVFLSMGMACLLLNIRTLLLIRRDGCPRIPLRSFRIRAYEIPPILLTVFLVFVSVWRCYYMPPTSRDALSGPEAIAEYALREHTMINSFFSVDLSADNNQFKSPFLISLQLIYKMAGLPFGQVWLSVVFISFTVLLYQWMRERLHPVIAGILLVLFTMTPQVYAYTFMILYDYSNMVFLFLSLYFLFEYFRSKEDRLLYFAAMLMGIATYIRSETLVLAAFFLPALLLMQIREKDKPGKMLYHQVLFMLPSLLAYYITVQLYIRYYLPVHYDISSLMNEHPGDLHPLARRFGEIFSNLLTGEFAIQCWGYFMYIFVAIVVADLLCYRRFSRDARNWLYAVGVIFACLGLLGFLLPLFDLTNTTKRGLMKLIPLMLFYMATSGILTRLSGRITRWQK